MVDEQDKTNRPRRRWFQFRLRTLMLALTVFGIWLGVRVQRAHENRQAVAEVRRVESEIRPSFVGGHITVRRNFPTWLESLFGDPGVLQIIDVDARLSKFNDGDMVLLKGMTELDSLNVEGTQISDAGTVHLKELTKLEELDLGSRTVPNAMPVERFVRIMRQRCNTLETTKTVTSQAAAIERAGKNTAVIDANH